MNNTQSAILLRVHPILPAWIPFLVGCDHVMNAWKMNFTWCLSPVNNYTIWLHSCRLGVDIGENSFITLPHKRRNSCRQSIRALQDQLCSLDNIHILPEDNINSLYSLSAQRSEVFPMLVYSWVSPLWFRALHMKNEYTLLYMYQLLSS